MRLTEEIKDRIDRVILDPRLSRDERVRAEKDAERIKTREITPQRWFELYDPDEPKPVEQHEPAPAEQAVAVRDPAWDRARNHYLQSGRFARRSVEEAYRCGAELLSLRARTPHGEWMPALKREGIVHETARRFMLIAEHLEIPQLVEFGSVRSAMEAVQGRLSLDQESHAPEETGPTPADYEQPAPAPEPEADAEQPEMFEDRQPEHAPPDPQPETPQPEPHADPVVVTEVEDDPDPEPDEQPTERAVVTTRPKQPTMSQKLEHAITERDEARRELQERDWEIDRLKREIATWKTKRAGDWNVHESVTQVNAAQEETRVFRQQMMEWQAKAGDAHRRIHVLERKLRDLGVDP